jgi:hypothetical protein
MKTIRNRSTLIREVQKEARVKRRQIVDCRRQRQECHILHYELLS